MTWIDSHCHLDAPEYAGRTDAVRAAARDAGVGRLLIPAVEVAHFPTVQALAHAHGDGYALGIHPLYVHRAQDGDLDALDAALRAARSDPQLLAVGEIGLDYFVPQLKQGPLRQRQEHFCAAQLRLARRHDLPVVLHVRRSADALLGMLRSVAREGQSARGGTPHRWRGIAHAFNGSLQQAMAFVALGFKLGFGGALTFERALQLRALVRELPLEAIVLETDAPDIPPQWLYRTAQQRGQGLSQGINSPAELPRIAAVVAQLRGLGLTELQLANAANFEAALGRR